MDFFTQHISFYLNRPVSVWEAIVAHSVKCIRLDDHYFIPSRSTGTFILTILYSTRSGANPISYPVDTRASFPRYKCVLYYKADHSSLFSAMKRKYTLCSTKHHTIKTWESGSIGPYILNLDTRWRRVVSFTLQ